MGSTGRVYVLLPEGSSQTKVSLWLTLSCPGTPQGTHYFASLWVRSFNKNHSHPREYRAGPKAPAWPEGMFFLVKSTRSINKSWDWSCLMRWDFCVATLSLLLLQIANLYRNLPRLTLQLYCHSFYHCHWKISQDFIHLIIRNFLISILSPVGKACSHPLFWAQYWPVAHAAPYLPQSHPGRVT